MTEQEREEFRKWDEENNKRIEEWYNTTLPTMPYYTPLKEHLYVGMPCEKLGHGEYDTEICCSGWAYHIYCLTASEDHKHDFMRDKFRWKPHILTQEEYDRYMNETGKYAAINFIMGEIRVKRENGQPLGFSF